MAKQAETELANFSFDEEVEFFGQAAVPDTIVLSEEEKKTAVKKTKEKKEEKKEEPEEDHDFFGITGKKEEKSEEEKKKETTSKKTDDGKEEVQEEETGEEEEVKDTKKEEKKEEVKKEEESKEEEPRNEEFFTQLTQELIESGVFTNIELKKNQKVSEDDFFGLYEQEIDSRVDESFESFAEELDDDGKAFLKFKKNGGQTSDFFAALGTSAQKPKGDITDEKYQKQIVKYYYELEGKKDAEEIDDQIEWLVDGGKLEKYAKKFDKKIDDDASAERARLEKAAETEKAKAKKLRENFQKSVQKILNANDEIGGFPIAKKEKTELLNYVTKATEKTGKNRYVTKFNADLMNVLKDDNKLLLIAKIIKDDFDFSPVEDKGKTKQVKRVKSRLEQLSKDGVKPKGSGSSANKALSEYF